MMRQAPLGAAILALVLWLAPARGDASICGKKQVARVWVVLPQPTLPMPRLSAADMTPLVLARKNRATIRAWKQQTWEAERRWRDLAGEVPGALEKPGQLPRFYKPGALDRALAASRAYRAMARKRLEQERTVAAGVYVTSLRRLKRAEESAYRRVSTLLTGRLSRQRGAARADTLYALLLLQRREEMRAILRGRGGLQPPDRFKRTVALARQLLKDHPKSKPYRAATLYILAEALTDTGRHRQAIGALDALVCANRHGPPQSDPPTKVTVRTSPPPTKAPPGGCPPAKAHVLCEPVAAAGKALVALAWMRLGLLRYQHDRSRCAAQEALQQAGRLNRRYLTSAAYLSARCQHKMGDSARAAAGLDGMLTTPVHALMQPQALDLLTKVITEDEADVDAPKVQVVGRRGKKKLYILTGGCPGANTLKHLERKYAGRHHEPHVSTVYREAGLLLKDLFMFEEAEAVLRTVLRRWPLDPMNPQVWSGLVAALERSRRFDAAAREGVALVAALGPGSRWRRHNRQRAEALHQAKRLVRRHLEGEVIIVAARIQRAISRNEGRRAADVGRRAADVGRLVRACQRYRSVSPNGPMAGELRAASATLSTRQPAGVSKALALIQVALKRRQRPKPRVAAYYRAAGGGVVASVLAPARNYIERSCLETAFGERPLRLDITVDIGARGAVTRATVTGRAGSLDGKTEECLTSGLKRLRYPPSISGDVRFTLVVVLP